MSIKMEQENKSPTGIKVISILNYIFGVFGIIFGIIALIGGITFIFRGDSMAGELFGGTSPGTIGSLVAGEFGRFST